MYLCTRCQNKFQTPTLLIKHLKIIHFLTRQSLKISCMQNFCNQTFTDFTHFRIHLERVHANEGIQNDISVGIDNSESHYPINNTILQKECNTSSPQVDNNVKFDIQELKFKALELSLSLYSKNSMPRSYVIEVQKSVSSLISFISQSISNLLGNNHIQDDLKTILSFYNSPFNDISTKCKMIQMLKSLELYDDPKFIFYR